MKSYQYSLLRYVNDVSTEEFANVGIVMWIPTERSLLFRLTEHYARLSDFYADFNGNDYKYLLRNLKSALEFASKNNFNSQAENILDILAEIVPIESGCFQWSSPMSGVVEEPKQRLDRLFTNIIAVHEENKIRPRREEKDIIETFSKKLNEKGLLENNEVTSNIKVFSQNNKYCHQFKYGWKNGTDQYAEAVSLDYKNKKDMENKANSFIGNMFSLRDAGDFQVTAIVAPPTQPELKEEFKNTVERLQDAPKIREIILESEIVNFMPKVEQDIQNHKKT